MIPPAFNHLTPKRVTADAPGRPQIRGDRRGADRADQEQPLPLSITLPATVLVSLALWAGIIMAVKSLL
jgi:hypothetical protein